MIIFKMCCLIVSTLLFTTAYSLELELKKSDLSINEKRIAQEIINSSLSKLPPVILKELDIKVPLIFSNIDGKEDIYVDCKGDYSPDLPASQLGGVHQSSFLKKNNSISLHRAFLKKDLNGLTNCPHSTYRELAQASLLHEIVHLYDFYKKRSSGFLLSKESHFLDLNFWKKSTFRLVQQNNLKIHSPDVYEFANPQETLAVNFEYFILDPNYKCRRPGQYLFFQSHFNFMPYPEKQCAIDTNLEFKDVINGSAIAYKRSIDPSRVYQIQYFLAGEGSAMMSRWGHAMFKIILCSPGRKTVGPECLNDKFYHVIVGFRAMIDDLKISTYKGIVGKYPSSLFIQTYLDTFEEYARGELRSLYSIPLLLTEQEKKQFIWQVLDTNNNYRGKYTFLTNNCADEALKLLKRSSSRLGLHEASVLTPLGLVDVLADLGLIKEKNYKKEEYTIPSELSNVNAAFSLIAPYFKLSLKDHNLSEVDSENDSEFSHQLLLKYLRNTRAEDRIRFFKEVILNNPSTKIVSSFLLLEQNFIKPYFMKRLAGAIEIERDRFVKENLISPLDLGVSMKRTNHYGLALKGEVDSNKMSSEMIIDSLNEWNKKNSKFQEIVKEKLAPALEEVSKINENTKSMLSEYKRLKTKI